MKIKMRTDDVSTPGRNEWAEMNDWLAELKDESQADEGSDSQADEDHDGKADEDHDSQASLTGVGEAEQASGPGPAHDARPVHDRQRAANERTASNARTASDPRAARNARPVQDPRPITDPRPVHDPRPVRDPQAARNPRSVSGPRTVTDPRPVSDPQAARNPRPVRDRRPVRDPQAARNPRPVSGPRTVTDPRAASNPQPVHDPRAARHERPAGRVNGRTPAAPPMRPVIGDELRMPIMWCEMGSCISWHADPSALGEADNRARAIQAGWRIDALGRMTCPQCQQTTVAFRATRPVVLWDRATAIAMAARAAAPRYRTMGSAGRASDRRPRPVVGRQ